MSTTVTVRFTKPWRTYFPGDVAGFEKDIADALVGGGVATAYSDKPVGAPIDKAPKPATNKAPARRVGTAKVDNGSSGAGSLVSALPAASMVAPEPGPDNDGLEDADAGGGEGEDGPESTGSTVVDGSGGEPEEDDDDAKP
ncbi:MULTISPECIES: hypothetical protein [Pseudomonas]|uniref:Uncharacterized protein n=1 Tax=Pseudomonas fortuita TaxID=3233375 RepID=A0ACD4PBS9_9PSED|nr:hypothetical protein [Pseudomonas putida]QDY37601.1 hypothetical protein CHR26_15580 [Pseudomonas putida]WAP65473.1 hypothetical protein OZ911_08745 [Pseudomonas putida]